MGDGLVVKRTCLAQAIGAPQRREETSIASHAFSFMLFGARNESTKQVAKARILNLDPETKNARYNSVVGTGDELKKAGKVLPIITNRGILDAPTGRLELADPEGPVGYAEGRAESTPFWRSG